MAVERKRRIYRGWFVVAAGFLNYMVVWGGVWYSFSVFYNRFIRDFQWGKGETAGVFSICASIVFLTGPFVGGLLDRYGPRFVLPFGSVLLGSCLLLCRHIDSLADFYLYYGICCACGMSFLMFTPQTSIILRWFHIRRATALGMALSGGGLGMICLVPLTQWIIMMRGWQAGYLFLSALVFLVVLPANIFLVRFPHTDETEEEAGLPFWGTDNPAREAPIVTVDTVWTGKIWTLREAVRTRRFWILSFAGITGTALVIQTVFSHFIVMTTSVGYSAAASAKMLGLAGIMGTAGFVCWGRIADRIGREWSYTLGTASLFCGLLSFLFMNRMGGTAVFLLFAVLFGFGYGSRAPLMQSIWADIFQGPYFASIFGAYQMFLVVGMVGPWAAGFIVGVFGSYRPVILALMISLVVSCALVWAGAPRHVRRVA